ncbi:non-ribosomal peptide synthetase [Rhodococcus sp. AD45-ID]|nr:Tyrocidine synthase III [Rhodococcus sp. AD45]PSR42117.1 non-ribosomal peptide synthetase [Rhodococcus sp. AD45-ID]
MVSRKRLALTAAQAGMWFAQQLDPQNPTFVTGQCIEIVGPLDPSVLARAVDRVVAETPSLMARFAVDSGEVYQELGAWEYPGTDVVARESFEIALTEMREQLRIPLDPSAGPGCAVTIFTLGPSHHALFFRVHHTLIDVYGYSLLGRRIAAVHNAEVRGKEPPANRFDPLEVILDQDAARADSDAQSLDREFWSSELLGAQESVSLSRIGGPPASSVAQTLLSHTTLISAASAERITAAGRVVEGSWADVVTAAVAAYLARSNGSLDVTVGFPSMNRMGTVAAKVLTTAVNVLPLRVAVDPNSSLIDLAAGVRAAVKRTTPHAAYRSEAIHRDLRLPASSAGPVGPTVNIKPFGDTLRFDGAGATVHSLARGPVHDIAFIVRRLDESGELEIQIDADADRYTGAELARHASALTRLLESVTAEGTGAAIAQVSLLEPKALKVLAEWGGRATAFDDYCPDVLDLFDAQVDERGDDLALVAGAERLSYAELAARVDALAAELSSRGAGPESLVALALPRSASAVVALLAVLRCGGAYIPLDPQFPSSRLEYMLDDARPAILLTTAGFTDRISVPEGTAVATIAGGEISWSAAASSAASGARVAPANTAYVIYTSGSTGNPKGVMLDRRALARFVRSATDLTSIGAHTRLLALTTLSFDIAVLELFVPLTAGGSVILADENQAKEPAAIAALVSSESVTAVQATPSQWGTVLEHGVTDLAGVDVLVGGEALPTRTAQQLSELARSVQNMYGPTEATVWCTSTPVLPNIEWTGSIGRPYVGTAAVVLDRYLQPVNVGEIGELYVAGTQLARGYRGRPDLTATRFVADPFGRGRMYRTGDLVRWTESGQLEYLGRGDDQVKVRGHRIELGEIETVAGEFDTVGACVAVARSDGSGTVHLVGYVTAVEGAHVDVPALRAFIADRLPAYMVPSAIVVMDEFPLTPNLKIDRKALPAPDFGDADTGRSAETAAEIALSGMFADLLGLTVVGVDADFFTLGGMSLSATRLVARLKSALGVELSLRDVFDTPTVAGLALRVESAAPARPAIVAHERTDIVPLSSAQQSLWFVHQTQGPSATYNIPFALHLNGAVDATALKNAVAAVVARHRVLRTVVVDIDGVGFGRVLDAEPEFTDSEVSEADVQSALLTAACVPFDLEHDIPVRAHLVRSGTDTAVLLLVIHHIAGDEWSAGPMLTDLAAVYNGEQLPAEQPRIQYSDFAIWQGECAADPDLSASTDRQLGYWRDLFSGAPEELQLPYDRARPAVPTWRGGEVWTHTGAGVVHGLRSVTEKSGSTMFMLAQAAVAVLLSKLGAGEDITLGAPIAGRVDGSLEDTVGFFVTTVAQRVDLTGRPSLAEVLSRVRRGALDGFAHQDVAFEQVVDAVGVTRSLARHPLFQTMVQHRTPHSVPSFTGLSVSPSYVSTGTAKFDLTFEFVELADGLDVRIEYAEDLFDRATAETIAVRLRTVLEHFATDTGAGLQSVDVLLPAERNAQSVEGHTTRLLPELLDDAEHEFADRVALICGPDEYTYRELADRSNRLARLLIQRGIGTDVVVGIAVGRSIECVVALRAVIAAGAAYLPIDPSYPRARIEYMLADADPALVIVDADTVQWIRPDSEDATIAELEAAAAGLRGDRVGRVVSPAAAAYVVYTSGSTGQPKGVMGTAGALANRLVWQRDLVRADGWADVRLAKSSMSFIDGSTELLAGLLAGARLVLADDAESRDAGALADLIDRHGVRQLTAVPSLAAALAQFREESAHRVSSWFLSGEPLTRAVIDLFDEKNTRVINSYGSSEVAGDVTFWTATSSANRVLIGAPVPGVGARILDAYLRPVPDGVTGELYVEGIQVARGYLGRPELTATRFVADPMGSGGRLFRTGDLVRRTRSGELDFVSRADAQMSLHGFRIEPGEVEAALASHPSVERALVVVRASAAGSDQLVGYAVWAPGAAVPDDSQLRAHLRDLLPDYMIPAVFVVLDGLPVLPNGKVDRDALPAPVRSEGRREAATELERIYCELLAELLGITTVGPDEDFFALGGNSLLATRLASAIRARTGHDVTIREVFDLRTPAELARAAQIGKVRRPELVRRDHGAIVPMSAAQGRLWFLFQLEGPSSTYNIPYTMHLQGSVDLDALRGALAHVLSQHETLRTVFTAESGDSEAGHIGYQVVRPISECELPLGVLDVLPAELESTLAREAAYTFDIAHELPVRAVLLRTGTDDAHLMVLVHHIAADEWSARPLVSDLTRAYSHLVSGTAAMPEPLPVQYRDFSAWQPEVLGEASDPESVLAGQLEYWTGALAGQPEELALPRDRARPAVSTYRGSAVAFELEPQVRASLAAIAAAGGATMFMLTHAAVAVLLAELGAGDDIVVGSPVAGRSDAALERVVGFFVNTLVLRTDLSGDPTFAQFLERVRAIDLDAYAHQDVPFEQLVEAMAPARSLSRQPLFQILVQYRDAVDRIEMAGLDASPVFLETGTAKFDLTFDLAETADGGIRGRIEYATDLFDRGTVDAFAGRLVQVLRQCAANPELRLSQLDSMTRIDRAAIESAESGRIVPLDSSLTLPGMFARQVALTPGAVAMIVDESGESLTYTELDRRTERLAATLRGVVPVGGVVAVAVRRSAALVVTLLAIHRVGATYLPLDDSYPVDRLEYMLADARPSLLVVGPGIEPLDCPAPMLEVDEGGTATTQSDTATAVDTVVHPDSAAYLLYTSGSTGRPKGVLVSHRAVVNRLLWMQDEYHLGSDDRVLQKTPAGFDVSVWEFFWPLITGATLVVAAPDGHRDPRYLRDVVKRRSVTTAHFVPSMLAAFLDHVAVETDPRPKLSRVLCSGEALTPDHRDRFHALVDAELHNLYGPTEAAVDVTASHIVPAVDTNWVTIGRPLWNTRVLVLDARLRRVAPGVAGELYLGGVQLARGYHDRASLTSERFVADPFGEFGERLYRTGDLVRWREYGDAGLALEYLGRTDGQVKLRGLRVELGEIENVLTSHPTLAQCAVVARGGQIHAYVVPVPDATIVPAELAAFASTLLPDYMVPTAMVVLDTLPLTPNGKLDRRALPEPVAPDESQRRAPEGPEETAMCELFAEALRVDAVGADDDFFMLGGDSIISIQVVNAAGRRGITFGPKEIFQWRTPAALAKVVDFGAPGDAETAHSGPVDPSDVTGSLALTPLVHRARESGISPAGLGIALSVSTPAGTTVGDVEQAMSALLQAHDALRLRLTRVASVLWSLETDADVDAVVQHVDCSDLGDADLAVRAAAEATALIAELDLENGRTVTARWLDAGESRSGTLVVAVHALAADPATVAKLRADLETIWREGGGVMSLRRPAATAHGFAERFNELAQDPALMGELTHWSQVLAPGAELRPGAPAILTGGPRGTYRATLEARLEGDVETAALAALTYGLARWRAAPAELTVELERDARIAGSDEPDPSATVGPFAAGVPVRLPALAVSVTPEDALAAAAAALSVVPGGIGTGYGKLRYLNAQTAPVFAMWGRPEVSLRVIRDVESRGVGNFGDERRVDPRVLDVTAYVTGDGRLVEIRFDFDATLFGEDDALAVAAAFGQVELSAVP